MGFEQSTKVSKLYFLKRSQHFFTLILVVAYIELVSNNRPMVERLKYLLQSTLKVNLLGSFKLFIGWNKSRKDHEIYLNRSLYVELILLRKNKNSHAHPVNTLLPVSYETTPIYDREKYLNYEEHKRYLSLVTALSYLGICNVRKINSLFLFWPDSCTLPLSGIWYWSSEW